MTEEDVEQCREFYRMIRRFTHAFGRRLGVALARRKITVPQYMAMIALNDLGQTTMGRLSKRLHVTMGASTNLVDKLIQGSHVSRARSTTDRRVVNVKLERKGRNTLKEIEDAAVSLMSEVMNGLAPEKRKVLIESFREMAQAALAGESAEAQGNRVSD